MNESSPDLTVALMREQGTVLERFVLLRLRHTQDLDDAIQEIYLRLLRSQQETLIRHPFAYLYGIARHVISEFNLRHKQSWVLFDSDVAEAAAETRDQCMQSAQDGAMLERQVSEALASLSPKHLAVLMLEKREGLSHSQIAEKLGLSIHTVKKYSVEAMVKVRASMSS